MLCWQNESGQAYPSDLWIFAPLCQCIGRKQHRVGIALAGICVRRGARLQRACDGRRTVACRFLNIRFGFALAEAACSSGPFSAPMYLAALWATGSCGECSPSQNLLSDIAAYAIAIGTFVVNTLPLNPSQQD